MCKSAVYNKESDFRSWVKKVQSFIEHMIRVLGAL